jgi:hypothetical protein
MSSSSAVLRKIEGPPRPWSLAHFILFYFCLSVDDLIKISFEKGGGDGSTSFDYSVKNKTTTYSTLASILHLTKGDQIRRSIGYGSTVDDSPWSNVILDVFRAALLTRLFWIAVRVGHVKIFL